jgi:hypothetical protein
MFTPIGTAVRVCMLSALLFASAGGAEPDIEDVTKMAAYNVRADRVEEFGFRVSWHIGSPWEIAMPDVKMVFPNTAADKAGLRPGDRILATDGREASVTVFSMGKWRQLHAKKWAEVAAGKKSVTWTLEVESADRKERRTVKMVVPTPPPHWGATRWQPPEGRVPAVIAESGPLAELARQVLDHGIWAMHGWANLPGPVIARPPEQPFLGYQWSLSTADGANHIIFVSQQRGRTDILLERHARDYGSMFFSTSPSGGLETARLQPRGDRARDMDLESARIAFQKEMNFWLKEVGRVTGRWPFELLSPAAATAVVASNRSAPPSDTGVRAPSFLKLPPATEAQRALFADALGKLGADEQHWAYTETSRGLDDKHRTVVRVDPSKPGDARCTLLKLDGKTPTPAQVKRWREEGRDATAALGDLPPLGEVVDLNDVRLFAEETTATVFELPLRAGSKEFPAEKFQARFRVNKTHRGFEDFAVKMKEAFRVAGVAKVTEAGIEARFQTFDPTLAPQPVLLKAGGAVRVLLVKIGRSFEATRTDFRRVEPYAELLVP